MSLKAKSGLGERSSGKRGKEPSSSIKSGPIIGVFGISRPPESIGDFWSTLVPSYTSRNYGALSFSLIWDPEKAQAVNEISEKRGSNRIAAYLDSDELSRVKAKLESKREASIRFGVRKGGHGYSGERGDFCMIGGVVRPKALTLYYRSLELIGGLAYDLVLIRYLEEELGCCFRQVDFVTAKAFVFALRGNSNEKLYPKLKEIYRG